VLGVCLQYPECCGKFAVKSVRDLTTGYDSSQPDGKAVSSTLLPLFFGIHQMYPYLILSIINSSVKALKDYRKLTLTETVDTTEN